MQQNTIIILAIVLILTCSCLAFFSGLGLGFGFNDLLDQTDLEAQLETEEPTTYHPPEHPAREGSLLLEDNFSRKRWETYEDTDHRKGYEDGRYVITVDVEGYSYWSTAEENLADFILELNTIQLSGPVDNDYGVILRYQDDANFYSFEISGDGFYTFTKYVEDELFEIIPWQESHLIHQSDSSNKIRVEAVGPNFTFYINGELVDAAIDSEFSRGDIGLLVGTYDEAGVTVAFDNLKVWSVK